METLQGNCDLQISFVSAKLKYRILRMDLGSYTSCRYRQVYL